MNPHLFPRTFASLVFLGLSLSASAKETEEPETALETPAQQSESQAQSTPRNNRGVIELESQVTGNQEQPQVFYVVPWQSPESPQLPYDPLGSQLEQVFGHLEREELRRELKQREQLQTNADSEPKENQ